VTRPERRPALPLPYRLRRPTVDPAAGATPLLVLLHGRGGNELAMAALAERFDPRYLVVSPRAPIETAPFSYQWFPETFLADGPRVTSAELATAVDLFDAFLGDAVRALGANPAWVHVAGFSQGGTLALATLLANPHRVAATVSMSGWLPRAALEAAGPTVDLLGKPVLIMHGRRDETIDARLGREAHAALASLGLAAELREPEVGHTTTPETIADVSAWLSRLMNNVGAAA
jgi:phospholipase/carboxylesterase